MMRKEFLQLERGVGRERVREKERSNTDLFYVSTVKPCWRSSDRLKSSIRRSSWKEKWLSTASMDTPKPVLLASCRYHPARPSCKSRVAVGSAVVAGSVCRQHRQHLQGAALAAAALGVDCRVPGTRACSASCHACLPALTVTLVRSTRHKLDV